MGITNVPPITAGVLHMTYGVLHMTAVLCTTVMTGASGASLESFWLLCFL